MSCWGERDTRVLARMSAGKSPRYIRLPARLSPSGIVDDQRAPQAESPGEIDERRADPQRRAVGPGAFAARVVAQEDHVEAAQVVFLDDGLIGRERPGIVRRPRVVAVAHAPGRGQDGVVVQEGQIVDRHEADVGAAAMGRQRQVDSGVGGLLGADVGDDETDAHGVDFRGRGLQGRTVVAAWWRVSISVSRSSGKAGAT